MVSSPDVITIDDLIAQLGDGYQRFDAAEQSRHVAMLQTIRRPEDVALHAEREEGDCWTVTICTADRVGALSIIAGLFTANRLDILSADIYTLRFPQHPTGQQGGPRWRPARPLRLAEPPAPTRRLLDVFHVRALADSPPDIWRSFRTDLATLVALLVTEQKEKALDAIVDRVSEAFRAMSNADAKLPPVSIDLSNEAASRYTKLVVRSVDTSGFLFAFTNALAGFTIDIARAEIRTLEGEACDTFWVTDVGGRQIAGEDRIHELRVATTLVKQFTHLLPRSADPGQALRQFNQLVSQMLSRPQWTAELRNLESRSVLETLAELMGVSRFLWEDLLRMQHENLFPVLMDAPALDEVRSKEQLREDLGRRLRDLGTHAERVDELNAFKDREMFRVDLRHITGRTEFAVFAAELSQLAEVAVEAAAELSHEALRRQFGAPSLADGRRCPWCICALGKFGGCDLGFGSDLELIFAYEGEGATDGPTSIPNSLYFGRFVQVFLSILKARQEGIFEIDLRLRPHGKAGALASSREGFAQYYAEGGVAEQFERMALVRLRPVAGDAYLCTELLHVRDAFVYSGKPLDIENVRHLRRRQATELVPLGKVSTKYSQGGLVDVEYFVQARQIAVGHADPAVRVTNTLEAIARLADGGHISPQVAKTARESYMFLRRLIDALRVVRGHAKELTIPAETSREFAYLAHRLRYASPTDLQDAIRAQMASARALWVDALAV